MRVEEFLVRRPLLAAFVGLVILTVPACAGQTGDRGRSVRLMTHDSFNVSASVLETFEAETGLTVEVLRGGDAGQVVNQAILSAGAPQGDVLYGVDNTLLTRALDADVFEPYDAPDLGFVAPSLLLDPRKRVTPIDRGDVCLNYDVEALDAAGVEPPESLQDLAHPDYAGMLVVQEPATSSPGLAFMLATIAEFGEDGWLEYWEALVANDVAVTSGWEDAYFGRFSGSLASSGSTGDRPIVVSYASSPPIEVVFSEPTPPTAPTAVVEASCFQQVEFAGILRGTDVSAAARQLIDFLLSEEFQADIPLQMYVFPARQDVALPEVFEQHTAVPASPLTLDPELIEQHRDRWIEEWTRAVLG